MISINVQNQNDEKEAKSVSGSSSPKYVKWFVVLILVAAAVIIPVYFLVLKKQSSTNESRFSLNIPDMKPPVMAVSPVGIVGPSYASKIAMNDLSHAMMKPAIVFNVSETIKGRLYSGGPTDFTYRLGKVDERVAELRFRMTTTTMNCINSTSALYSPVLPLGQKFDMYFNCKDSLDNGLAFLFFGTDKTSTYFYVGEFFPARPNDLSMTSNIIVLAKVDAAANYVEIWQIISDDTSSTASYFHIVANRTSRVLGVSVAGVGSNIGLEMACGVQMVSNTNFMYASGEFADTNLPTGYVCQAGGNRATTSCASSINLSDQAGQCSNMQFVTQGMNSTALVADNAFTKAKALINVNNDSVLKSVPSTL